MLSDRPQCKIPLIFFRTDAGNEPVRDWLKGLPEAERQETGQDLLRAQWRWPVGMPLPSDERSRKRGPCRTTIWHWRASESRSWSDEQEEHGFQH